MVMVRLKDCWIPYLKLCGRILICTCGQRVPSNQVITHTRTSPSMQVGYHWNLGSMVVDEVFNTITLQAGLAPLTMLSLKYLTRMRHVIRWHQTLTTAT